MIRRTITVENELGLHLKAAAQIVEITTPAKCPVWLTFGATTVDAKSLLGITSLVAKKGTELVISASGPGEEDVVKRLCILFDSGFNKDC